MSQYLAALYGDDDDNEDEYYSSSNDEDSYSDQDPYNENQEELVTSEENDETVPYEPTSPKFSGLITSWSHPQLFPPKPSLKNIVPSLSRSKKKPERVIEYIDQEEAQQYQDKMFHSQQQLEQWNHTYHKFTMNEKTSIITKVPVRYVESHKLIYEKVDHLSSTAKTSKSSRDSIQAKVVDMSYDLALSNIVGCLSSQYIFLSGGEKHGNAYQQILAFDIHNKKWHNFTEIYNGYYSYLCRNDIINPPPTKDHILVELSGNLIWASWTNFFFIRSPSLNLEGAAFSRQWCPVAIEAYDTIDYTTNYSYSTFQNKFWIFGGRSLETKQVTNQLVEFELGRASYTSIGLKQRLVSSERPPLPRENHAQCQVDDKIFIYGGNYMETHQLLNDLHIYNTSAKLWIEIDLSFSPPPMRNHSMCSVGKYIYLSGGILGNNKIGDVLYRYNVHKETFSVVMPNHQDALVCAAGRAYHFSIAIHDHILLVGGLCDLENRKYAPHAALLHHTLDDGVENSAYVYLKHQFSKQKQGDLENYDLVLRVADRLNGESHYLYGHRTLLMTRSEYFKKLLKEMDSQQVEYSEDGTKMVMNIDKYHLDAMQVYVTFLYTGNVILPEDVEESCLQEIVELSKFDYPKHEIFSDISHRKKIYMDSSAQILRELKRDFNQLYSQVEQTIDNHTLSEPSFENSYADVTIQILDPHTHQVVHQLRAHKIFLSRSSYMEAVFSSKMEESTTGIIKFNEISLKGLLCVLKYLYTNQIVISIDTAIEVLLCALLFQLNEVANHARGIVRDHITVENALELVALADVYNDISIRNHCVKIISENYTELSGSEAFRMLPENVKSEAREKYLYKLRKLSKQKTKKFNNHTNE
ncbi:hypothetical protein C9374_009950 [Naegleria lovaniensis]|uniref:BTB domain-containing protein n=1 Tax=Naegleria lovaniensis TaxID=51637 RepID=A0AA88GGU2_NAELO|nr:uncharacterized protein C9374_009950 [Naegleria lovaniensis]KAG2375327.1 hypothetical protein C9374_009950 [Naegleria lovaniensis]